MKLDNIDFGLLFVAAMMMLVAVYLFVFMENPETRLFGGGAVLIVAIFLFIIPAFRKKK